MKTLSERRKRIALFVCLIVAALVLTTAQMRMAPQIAVVESLIRTVIMPLQAGLAKGRQRLHDIWKGYVKLTGIYRENVRLRRQVETLQDQLHRYQEAYLQQQRMRELLDFRSLTFPTAIPAEVLGIDPSPWSEALTINKGSNDGVWKDHAVVTHRGLVGHTVEVAPQLAMVLLLTDRRSAVDALVQRTRARGIVFGKSQHLVELRYVDVHEDIRVGDRIISSGFGDIYPKGLLIGTVTSVHPQRYGLFYEIEVQPAVDFSKLEEVLALGS